MDDSTEGQHTFSAVTNSARQLFVLLRCIGFAPKVQVQISEEGLRFNVEDSSIMEGTVGSSNKMYKFTNTIVRVCIPREIFIYELPLQPSKPSSDVIFRQLPPRDITCF